MPQLSHTLIGVNYVAVTIVKGGIKPRSVLLFVLEVPASTVKLHEGSARSRHSVANNVLKSPVVLDNGAGRF